jgi:hypothetical protein
MTATFIMKTNLFRNGCFLIRGQKLSLPVLSFFTIKFILLEHFDLQDHPMHGKWRPSMHVPRGLHIPTQHKGTNVSPTCVVRRNRPWTCSWTGPTCPPIRSIDGFLNHHKSVRWQINDYQNTNTLKSAIQVVNISLTTASMILSLTRRRPFWIGNSSGYCLS